MSAIETFDLRKDRNFPAELILSSNQLRKTITALAQNILFLRSINTASTVFTPPRIPTFDDAAQQQPPAANAIGKNTAVPRSATPPQASKNSSFAGTSNNKQQQQQQHPLFELAFSEEIENRSGGSSTVNQHYSFVDTKSIDEIMNELILLSSSSSSSSNSNNNNNKAGTNNQTALASYFSSSSSKSETKWKVRENHLEQLSLLAASASSSSSSSPADAELFSVPCLAARLLIIKVAVEQDRSSAAARGQSHVANNQNDVVVVSSSSTIPGLPLGPTTTTTKTSTTSASSASSANNGGQGGGGWFGSIVSATAGAFASAVVSATNTAVAAAVGTNNGSSNKHNLSAGDSAVFLKQQQQASSPFFGDGHNSTSNNSFEGNSNNNFAADEYAEKKRGLITKNVEVVEEWCIPIVILVPSEVQKLDRVIKRFKHMISAGYLSAKDSSESDDDDNNDDNDGNSATADQQQKRMKKALKLQNKRKAMLDAADREYFANAAALNSLTMPAANDHRNNNKRFENSSSQFGNPTQSSAAFALGEKNIPTSTNASPDPKLSARGENGNKNEAAEKRIRRGDDASPASPSSDDDDDAVLISDDEVMEAEIEEKKYKNNNNNASTVVKNPSAASRGSEQRQAPQHQNASNNINLPATLLPQESLEILASMLEPDSISRVQRVMLWMQEQVCQCGITNNNVANSATTAGFRRSTASSYELFENASKVVVSVSLGGLSSKEGKLVEPAHGASGKTGGTRDSPASTPTQNATTSSPPQQAGNNISGKVAPPPAIVTGNGWSLPKLW